MDRDHRARPTMSEIAEALHKLLLLIDGGDDMTKVSWKSRPKYNPLQSGNSMLEDVRTSLLLTLLSLPGLFVYPPLPSLSACS